MLTNPDVASACPRAVPDISAWPLFSGVYALGNQSLDSYVVIPEAKLQIAQEIVARLDGSRSLASIAEEYLSRGQAVDVAGLHKRLTDAGLLEGSKPTGELRRLAVPLFDVPVEPVFRSVKKIAFLSFVPLVWLTGIIIIAGIFFGVSQPSRLIALARGTIVIPPVLLYSMAAAGWVGTILWHELSHAVTALRYGLVPRRLSMVGYLAVIPVFVIRIPGIYLISPAKRIRVWAAGMWGSLALAALAALALRFVDVSLPWQQFLARVAIANVLVAAANLIPFLPTDGYFIFSTVFQQANLRQRAWREFKALIRFGRMGSGFVFAYLVLSGALMAFLVVRNVRSMYRLAQYSTPWFVGFVLLVSVLLIRARIKAKSSDRQRTQKELTT